MDVTKSKVKIQSPFDPTKNRHLWTMWRMRVTERIADEANQMQPVDYLNFPFGKSILDVPLKRYIRLESQILDNPAGVDYALTVEQYVFYGIPRVVLGSCDLRGKATNENGPCDSQNESDENNSGKRAPKISTVTDAVPRTYLEPSL